MSQELKTMKTNYENNISQVFEYFIQTVITSFPLELLHKCIRPQILRENIENKEKGIFYKDICPTDLLFCNVHLQ